MNVLSYIGAAKPRSSDDSLQEILELVRGNLKYEFSTISKVEVGFLS
jgi:hypothetical protein